MLFETIKSEGLAHLSYMLGDESAGVCVVIDPRRDVGAYLEIARQHQVPITHILETHVHADFVSGSRELSARTGAPIYGGVSSDYDFEIEVLEDDDTLEIGPFTIEVLHTPGHSPEHVCYVVRGGGKGAEHRWGVFTGDALFAGEVGRPDLADAAPEVLARQLYHSIQDKLLALSGGVEVYPAHGAGSPCGSSIGVRDRTTIGYERCFSDKLQLREDAFVEKLLDGLSQEPFYYKHLKEVNARGPKVLGMWPHLPALPAEAFREAMHEEQAVVVDTREIEAFGGAHVEGALSIALRKAFPVWAGWMLQPEQPILLVTEDASDVDVVQRHLLRTGHENIRGYLAGGMRSWIEAGLPFEQSGEMSVHVLKERIERGHDDFQVLDVRSESEWEGGHVPTARHQWLPFLTDHLDDLDRERPVAVYCGSGYRSGIAASILQRSGFRTVANVPGSIGAWKAAGYSLEEPANDASLAGEAA